MAPSSRSSTRLKRSTILSTSFISCSPRAFAFDCRVLAYAKPDVAAVGGKLRRVNEQRGSCRKPVRGNGRHAIDFAAGKSQVGKQNGRRIARDDHFFKRRHLENENRARV